MRKHSKLLLALLIISGQLFAQVTILENTPERLVIQWKIDGIDSVTVNSGKETYTIPSFIGQNAKLGKFKTPSAPAYSFFVGVPQQGTINVSLQTEDISTMHFTHPIKLQSDSSRQLEINFQSEWICEPKYSNIGPLRAAQFFIKPFIYDSETGIAKVFRSGKITIEFPSSPGIKAIMSESPMSKMLRKLLLNYSVARNWGAVKKLNKKAIESYPLQTVQKAVYFKIGDGHKSINEGTTNENGIIKITGDTIIKALGISRSISRIALYALYKGILPETVPDTGKIPDGISEIPLYRYDENGNGLVDKNDYLLAYVSNLSDWYYDNEFKFRIDPYDESRTYWLFEKSQNAKTMNKFTQPAAKNTVVNDYFINRSFCRQPNLRESQSEGGNNWFWKKLTPSDRTFTYNFDLPIVDTSFPGKLTLTNQNYGSENLGISFGHSVLKRDSIELCYVIPKWDSQNVKIEFNGSGNEYYELSSIQFEYKSKLLANSGLVRTPIFSSNDTGIVNYRFSNATKQKIYLFRIDTSETEVSLVDTFRTVSYTWSDTGHSGVKYFACNDSGFIKSPELSSVINLQSNKYLVHDLRSAAQRADYLIITHPAFISESQVLAAHKEKMGFKNPIIVDVNEIFQYFSGGNKDPTAIRNFLAYVKRNWTGGSDLLYVLLMGNGNHDPKNYLEKNEPDFIPIYQSSSDLEEDYYSYLEVDTNDTKSDNKPQLVIGRLPCKTKAEAEVLVNKILDMEDPLRADFGSWRNRALIVADDDMQGKLSDGIESHYTSSEIVADVISLKWPSMDLRKVYLFDYEWNAALEKPGVTRAILNEINNGVAYVNYFGHGSDDLWADEHVLTSDNISSMSNNKQYPVISSFSCDVGRFDVPGAECFSSALVKAPSAGACAAISSTRLAYATDNEHIAVTFYSEVFDSLSISIGAAFYMSKVISASYSHHTYSLLGDPSLQFINPERSIDLNAATITDSTIDTVMALQQIKIAGSIRKADNSIDTDFGNGTVPAYITLGLFNAPDSASRKDGGKDERNDGTKIRYLMPGTPVFLGKTAVRNGRFEQTVYTPKNLTFDKAGVKLTGYAWKDRERAIAIGVNEKIIFSGTANTNGNTTDSAGPLISIRPVYENTAAIGQVNVSFTDRITSSLPLKFQIDLFDESGIDITGSGPDEGLVYEIKGILNKKVINNKFQFKSGDIREGSASVEIEENQLKPGIYNLTVNARDLIGNISIKDFSLEITDKNELKLDHVFNYPNPFRMGQTTRFFFYESNTALNTLQPAVFYIKIYSLSGRLLRVFSNANNGVVWDGRDQAGNMLSPNVYLYQVNAYDTYNQKNIKSKIKKIVIHPPR